MTGADERGDLGRQRVRRQGAGGDDDGGAFAGRRQRRHLFADDRNQRMTRQRRRDRVREPLAIDRERRAGGHAALLGRAHDERSEAPHLLFQETHGVVELVAAKRIAAHELGEAVGLVDSRRTHGPHLVERHRDALRCGLPGGLSSGKAAADDSDHLLACARGAAPRACRRSLVRARRCSMRCLLS